LHFIAANSVENNGQTADRRDVFEYTTSGPTVHCKQVQTTTRLTKSQYNTSDELTYKRYYVL